MEKIDTLDDRTIKEKDKPAIAFILEQSSQWSLDKPILLVGKHQGAITVIDRCRDGEVSQTVKRYLGNGVEKIYVADLRNLDEIYVYTQ